MRRVFFLLERTLDIGAAVLVFVSLAAITCQVVMRYVFNNATTWSDTVAASSLAWLTFFAASAAVRRDENLAVRGLWDILTPTGRKMMMTFCDLLVLAFSVLLALSGTELMSITSNTVVEGMMFHVSWADIYSVSVISAAAIALFSFERIWNTWAEPSAGPSREGEP
ncbi:TRAP transporter small permease [Aquabacter sp. CN5-332]|uniref:TRAP transporter small permease n=1 Tax=Aquabacter sp. CN5-332 TaxID=3156608 RepID=UPI0032B4134B